MLSYYHNHHQIICIKSNLSPEASIIKKNLQPRFQEKSRRTSLSTTIKRNKKQEQVPLTRKQEKIKLSVLATAITTIRSAMKRHLSMIRTQLAS